MVEIFQSTQFHSVDNIVEKYTLLRDQTETKKTHRFEGRYENIYIQRDAYPEIEPLLTEAQQLAQQLLNLYKCPDLGFWFNEMHYGDRTLAHRHDDDDELLSGVLYLVTPVNSGDLLLGQGDNILRIKPKAGMFVFFAPNLIHEVEQSNSADMRLSIGMNFGLRDG